MTTPPTQLSAPQLAPPGAGLPAFELFMARLRFRWRRLRTSPEQAAAHIRSERDQIAALARSFDEQAGRRQVLIERLSGMEDSSRNWSIFMTVAHLRIVNTGIAGTISLLLRGDVPSRQASTAAVKPPLSADASEIAAFERATAAVLEAAEPATSLRTFTRFTHPWFGPLDAGGWFLLAGTHMTLHRHQLLAIQAKLAADAPAA